MVNQDNSSVESNLLVISSVSEDIDRAVDQTSVLDLIPSHPYIGDCFPPLVNDTCVRAQYIDTAPFPPYASKHLRLALIVCHIALEIRRPVTELL